MSALEDRMWAKVDKSGECWLWTASVDTKGYGRLAIGGGRTRGAHRLAYELLVGPIPEGLQIDHLCRVPRCVNPAHMEAVTSRENTLRGEGVAARRARQTHCKRGHALALTNTYSPPSAPTRRECRQCRRRRYG